MTFQVHRFVNHATTRKLHNLKVVKALIADEDQSDYSYTNAPDGFDNVKTAGVALDYWVNEQFSVSASYETDIDSDVDRDVASLTASYRF